VATATVEKTANKTKRAEEIEAAEAPETKTRRTSLPGNPTNIPSRIVMIKRVANQAELEPGEQSIKLDSSPSEMLLIDSELEKLLEDLDSA
jgi:hypothetical protein